MACVLPTLSVLRMPIGITKHAVKRFNHQNVVVLVCGIHYKHCVERNVVRRAFVLVNSGCYDSCTDARDISREHLCGNRKLKMNSGRILTTPFLPNREILLRPGGSLQRMHCRYASTFFQAALESTPVISAEQLLTSFHLVTELPWWATIVCTTILLRAFITTPLFVYQNLENSLLKSWIWQRESLAGIRPCRSVNFEQR